MENFRAALEYSVVQFCKTASIYTTVIVIFCYHVLLDKDLECTCEGQHTICRIYMFLPAVLIFILVLWTDKSFQRVIKYTHWLNFKSSFWVWVLLYHIFKAGFVGLLWVASVLLDGDWYVCCCNHHSEQAQLACKVKSEVTAVEQKLKAELKNESKVSIYLVVMTHRVFT